MTIELTLLQFPKIILMFAAVFFFSMIDSFGDLKALLPINHRLVEGVEMPGNTAGHIQREGLHRGKSYGKDGAKGRRKTLRN